MATTRNSLDAFAAGFAWLMIRLRFIVIPLAIAGAVYVGMNALSLEFSTNYRTFFSKENPELKTFENFQATYTKNDNFLFVVAPKDGASIFTKETLKAIHILTEESWQTPFVLRVDSLTNFQHTYAIDDELIVENLIENPSSLTAAAIAEKKLIALAEPLLRGQLVTTTADAAAVNVVLNYPERTLAEVPEAVAFARMLRERIKADYPNLDVYLTGTSMLNNAFSEASTNDFSFLVPLMMLIILVATAIAVRSVYATAATLLVIILSVMVAMGWAGLAGIKLAGPSPSAPIIILTLAIADSIHILMTTRQGMRRGLTKHDAIINAAKVNFLAITITSLTTIVGFLTLNFSDSPPFRDLGNITAVGILAAWFFSLTLLPALLAAAPLRVKVVPEILNQRSSMAAFADFVIGNFRKLLFVTVLGSAVLVSFIPSIELSDQFREYYGKRIEFRRESDEAIKYFGFYPVEFSVPAGEPGGVSDPAFLKKLDAFADWLRTDDRVTHVYAFTDIMKRLNKNMNADDPDFYRLPDDRDLAAQYLLLYELSLPYGLDLNDRINIDKSATRVTAIVSGYVSTKEFKVMLRDIDAWFDHNAPELKTPATGAQVMFTFIAQRNIESMMNGTVIAISVIALIMIISLRSVPIGFVSMVPNGLPVLAAFGVWALWVGEVGFSVSAVAPIAIGIVVDDTVHFLTKYMRARRQLRLPSAQSIRYAFETVGAAILVNTIILTSGFMVLAFSSYKINVEMGLISSLSIVFALILDFLLLPSLLLAIARFSGEKIITKGDDDAAISFPAGA